MHQPWLEISRAAFENNVSTIKNIIQTTNLGIVVKANAYGHGMQQIALLAEHNPAISHICTATTSEALALRYAGITKPIIALSYNDIPWRDVLIHAIQCVVYEESHLRDINAAAYATRTRAYVHLKVDSGMCRLGVMPEQCISFIQKILSYETIVLAGIFTHLSDTNNPDQSFTHEQLARFDTLMKKINIMGIVIPHVHACASGSLIEKNLYSLVRVGTSLYGYHKSSSQEERFKKVYPDYSLCQLITVRAPIIDIYHDGAITRAIVAAGTKDGLMGIPEYVMIKTKKAPVVALGLSYMFIDISMHNNINIGDSVSLIADIPGLRVNDHALRAGTIGNDIVTGLSPDLPRYLVP